jgi:hypothetical protein
MEPKTRFNLSAALQNWREELAAQPHLTAENRRELEAHVTDTIAEMQQRGLSDEESFWLARRRVGWPKELGQEFANVGPKNPGREWVLWIAVAFYVLNLWQNISTLLVVPIAMRVLGNFYWIQLAPSLSYVVAALLGIYVARSGFWPKLINTCFFIRSRARFFATCSFFVVKGAMDLVAILDYHYSNSQFTIQQLVAEFLIRGGFIWSAFLLAIILWLLPWEKSPASVRA